MMFEKKHFKTFAAEVLFVAHFFMLQQIFFLICNKFIGKEKTNSFPKSSVIRKFEDLNFHNAFSRFSNNNVVAVTFMY